MTHVLIVDDESHTRLSLSFILESAGYLVSDAAEGYEALQKIVASRKTLQPVDLLILDIEMPGLTGWELMNELEIRHLSLPTVIITGFNDNEPLGKFLEERDAEFLVKPFTPERLTASISRLLQDRKPFEKGTGYGHPVQRSS